MGLLSKFKSRSSDAARAGASPADANEVVRDVRARARRRLIGAALLLGVGIIGFPLLFETQPRPIAVDIPIEIPSRDSAPPLRSPATRPARSQPAVVARPPDDAPAASLPSAAEPAPKPLAEAPVEPKPATKPAVKPADAKPESKPEPKPAAKPVEVPKTAELAKAGDTAVDNGRFVVQIGAFAEATGAREARMKVEGMGLKTYTQVIESASGRRIRVRVGPYATKAEADKAAARIKASGLQAAVLVL
ncbi:SPOR domain-containing protein [Ideonella sp.]|uniref:SPOR domain-containing protein n=1 Tax=Ideonella sp. TaxID=1929293 RepID=UPI002B4721C6|nr:SPOR domain-containing protein [Ideonella sp.]HJV71517.1 SPOR domain-containing protein [Ideonella sp.]